MCKNLSKFGNGGCSQNGAKSCPKGEGPARAVSTPIMAEEYASSRSLAFLELEDPVDGNSEGRVCDSFGRSQSREAKAFMHICRINKRDTVCTSDPRTRRAKSFLVLASSFAASDILLCVCPKGVVDCSFVEGVPSTARPLYLILEYIASEPNTIAGQYFSTQGDGEHLEERMAEIVLPDGDLSSKAQECTFSFHTCAVFVPGFSQFSARTDLVQMSVLKD